VVVFLAFRYVAMALGVVALALRVVALALGVVALLTSLAKSNITCPHGCDWYEGHSKSS